MGSRPQERRRLTTCTSRLEAFSRTFLTVATLDGSMSSTIIATLPMATRRASCNAGEDVVASMDVSLSNMRWSILLEVGASNSSSFSARPCPCSSLLGSTNSHTKEAINMTAVGDETLAGKSSWRRKMKGWSEKRANGGGAERYLLSVMLSDFKCWEFCPSLTGPKERQNDHHNGLLNAIKLGEVGDEIDKRGAEAFTTCKGTPLGMAHPLVYSLDPTNTEIDLVWPCGCRFQHG